MNTTAEPMSARVSAFVASASAIWQRPLARLSAVLPSLHRGFRFAESMHGEARLNGTRHDMVFRVPATVDRAVHGEGRAVGVPGARAVSRAGGLPTPELHGAASGRQRAEDV